MVEVALYQPQIPPNTGNIGRLCVGFSVRLNLIGPLGFSLAQKALRRAGLDYWPQLAWRRFANFERFEETLVKRERQRLVAFSKRGRQELYSFSFLSGAADQAVSFTLLFGSETSGLPPAVLERNGLTTLRLPQSGKIRSYNLANAVAMALGESYRQLCWPLLSA